MAVPHTLSWHASFGRLLESILCSQFLAVMAHFSPKIPGSLILMKLIVNQYTPTFYTIYVVAFCNPLLVHCKTGICIE